MTAAAQGTWTLDELVAEVATAVKALGLDPASGRVSAAPDARALRWYATAGLMGRPSGHRGRLALYDRSHLRQVVAIKRLQAEGLTLAEVQLRLAGLDAVGLHALAALPGDAAPLPPPPVAPTARSFWSVPVVEVAAVANETEAAPASPRPSLTTLQLAPDALLTLAGHTALDAAARERLLAAAAPLLAELAALETEAAARSLTPTPVAAAADLAEAPAAPSSEEPS